MTFEKHKHFSPDIERAILGACLIEKNAFGKIYQAIERDSFYYTANQVVFSTIKDMYINGIPIDIFTVVDQLKRVQNINNFQGTAIDYFIPRLTNDVVNSTHIEYHCYLIKTMWMEREIMRIAASGATLEGDTKQKISDLQQRLYSLQQQHVIHDWQDMSQLMVSLYQHQEEIKKSGGVGITTGIKDIDYENGGLHPGQMVVIGARPSVGKSAFAGSIALHAAKKGHKVGIISLEMSNNEIAARLAAIDTDTDFRVLYRGLYKDEIESHKVYEKIAAHTSQLPIYVSDKTNITAIDIRSKADKLASLHGLDMLIIDYLQLIDVPEMANRNRENEIAKVSRYTKIMAKELNIPVILLCQLNRESVHRKGDDRYPRLSDIRESGSIEQDADVVMFLHRDWMIGVTENEDQSTTEFEADLIIRKWRNGKNNFMIPLDFHPSKMLFTERLKTFEGYNASDTQYFN